MREESIFEAPQRMPVKEPCLTEGDALVALRLVGESSADSEALEATEVPTIECGELLVGSDAGIINRLRVRDIPVHSRTSRGCRLMRIAPGDSLTSVSLVPRAAEGGLDDEDAPLVVPEGGASDEESEEEEVVVGAQSVKATVMKRL
ncbi:hypothetical protein CLOM_g260 [Closterium sp. NIES-68]|nr:hypothetical protein CLOM_g260 [Closterium sp. NIES-68]